MSRHISISLLRNCNNKLHIFNPFVHYNHLISSSLPNLYGIKYLHPPSLNENIQVSKLFQSVIHRPVSSILATIQKERTSGKESVKLLKTFRMQVMFNGIESSSFKNDSKFQTLCDIFSENCSELPPNLLISGLRSLLEVGVSPDLSCVVLAEKNVIKNVYNFSSFNLIGCLYYHHKFMQTDLQKKVVAVLVSEIQNRLYEISSPSEILMLIHIYHLFKDESKKNVEKKIIELIPLLNTQEICKAICTLAEKCDRNIFILHVLVFYLRQKSNRPSMKETIDVCYASKKLNFIDPKLCTYLLNHIDKGIPSIQQSSFISGLLSVCGHLRWKHLGILEACGDWIKSHLNICRTREIVAYVLTVGALNHHSPHTKTTINLLLQHLTLEKVESPSVFLDVVWSLGILDCLSKDLLLKVLSPEFYEPLINESESQASSSVKLKLLNLKSILKIKYPECIFGCNLYLEPFKLHENPLIENSRKHVIKVLSNFVPENKCLCENQVCSMGTFIDAEFIMDANWNPLSLQEYGTMASATSKTKPLPKSAKRIALLIMFQKDYTLSTPTLTGVNALGVKLLTEEGYTVIQIPYNNFSRNKTEVEKAKYLLEKIKKS